MELLLRRGHVDPSAFAAASLSSKHANAVRTACLRFGRQRPELIRHISRCDIQVALRCGCPSIDRKVVNSGKRLRAYVGLVEGELAKKLHPDTNKGDADAEPKFQEVQRAYEFFRNIFRDRDFGSHDIKVALELSFMEAVQGCSKTINFQTSVTCETCNGAGVPPGTKPETCLACRGSGFMFMQTGPFRMQSTCTKCGGSGKTVKDFCRFLGRASPGRPVMCSQWLPASPSSRRSVAQRLRCWRPKMMARRDVQLLVARGISSSPRLSRRINQTGEACLSSFTYFGFLARFQEISDSVSTLAISVVHRCA
ncbi:hypothetical protein ZEAMMB73_Zm00001d033741 [Zea mays]|uniref:Uncharacterized protein n=1 Tax=Zea mays TaxID=4577 RepID=A0A1D6L1Y2_MAIZE|nr:hypothetical protein ZEAMMB73_Zm00001d033741 [Zea mays]